jgi:hypothetical protein
MKMDKSFDGRSCQEQDWNSFDIVSVPDRDDLSQTVTEVQALIHEGQALLIAGRGPEYGVDDQESSHGTGKGTRALSSSALMTSSRETQTIHESPGDSGATAIPVLESPPQASAEETMWLRITTPHKTSSTQKLAENILHSSSSQVKESKNVQDRDFMAPSASTKVPSYIEMLQTLSLDDTDSVQQCCIGTTMQGQECKDTTERGCNCCCSHLCGKNLPEREALIDTIHQCRGFSRGNRCENAAKKGYFFCGGHRLPSTTVAKPAIPSKATMPYGRNAMPPTAILATETIVMCVGPSCRDMAKKGSLYCRQHMMPDCRQHMMPYGRKATPPTAIPETKTVEMCVGSSCRDMAKKGSLYCRQHLLPAIPVLVRNDGVARCVAITKTGKQCVDLAIRSTSYCFNHAPRSSSVCAAVTKTGKLCVDPTVGSTLFCYNHRHLATSLVVKTQTAVQTAAVNHGVQRLAAFINFLHQKKYLDGTPAGGRATAGAGRSHRCQGLTEVGKRCKDTAKKNSRLCGRHSTGSSPVGAEDVMMSQLIGYIDGRLDSMKHAK